MTGLAILEREPRMAFLPGDAPRGPAVAPAPRPLDAEQTFSVTSWSVQPFLRIKFSPSFPPCIRFFCSDYSPQHLVTWMSFSFLAQILSFPVSSSPLPSCCLGSQAAHLAPRRSRLPRFSRRGWKNCSCNVCCPAPTLGLPHSPPRRGPSILHQSSAQRRH